MAIKAGTAISAVRCDKLLFRLVPLLLLSLSCSLLVVEDEVVVVAFRASSQPLMTSSLLGIDADECRG
jgi:hypothetical protein